MLSSESYPQKFSYSLSPLYYSVRFENYFCSVVSGVEIETPPSSSFLTSSDLFENSLHYMVYSSLLSSTDFSKKYLRLLFPSFLLPSACTSADLFKTISATWYSYPSSPIQNLSKMLFIWCPHTSSTLKTFSNQPLHTLILP